VFIKLPDVVSVGHRFYSDYFISVYLYLSIYLPTCLFSCFQQLHSELTQNSAKTCHMVGNEPRMRMRVQTFGLSPLLITEIQRLFIFDVF